MAYQVIWTEIALAQLKEIVDYLAAKNPAAVERVGNAILSRVEGLATAPFSGAVFRTDSRGKIREILAMQYRIFYRVDEHDRVVRVITLWHGARSQPVLPE